MKPVHFDTAAGFHRWLQQNHGNATELLVGFYNQQSGRGGLTYPEALDAALCHGWIDGIRKRFDADSYTIRFTPRKPDSIWSNINIGHVKRLTAAGKMQPAGIAAFKRRDPKKSGIYSFENRPKVLAPEVERVFRRERKAWSFWEQQPPGYRRTITWWVMSAKRDETRQRRLAQLMAACASGRRVGLLTGPAKPDDPS